MSDKSRKEKEAYRDAARCQYGSDDVQIDQHARVAVGERGAFVAAWVYVSCDNIQETTR